MNKIHQQCIAVLMGGASSEREISLRSGAAVFAALKQQGLDVVAVDLVLNTKLWHRQIKDSQAEVAFIALHGTYGEDGCIQGLLESMQIPYTGSDVLASALCMDKRLTKSVLQIAGVKTPRNVILKDRVPTSYPVFVKPVAEGSSVGLHYVKDAAEWLALGIQDTKQWLIEDCVLGMEVAVGVLNGKALTPVEIEPKSGRYDFESKYTVGATDYYCPARLSTACKQKCMEIAEQAVAVLGCSGAPRADLIVPKHGEPVLLEVNTIPGMTATSLLPKAAAEMGISFEALCVAIVETAQLGGTR